MFLLLHLGMVPVLTAQNKPFFVRRAEAKNYDGSVYNYDAPGLNPDIKWGYKNWQKWEVPGNPPIADALEEIQADI